MTNSKVQSSKVYDLEERTAIFGEDIIEFVKSLKKGEVNRPLINQLIRSGASVGANYMEADGGRVKERFSA